MKKLVLVTLVVLSHLVAVAQQTEADKYLVTTRTNSLGYVSLQLTDPYLSPLTYSGSGFDFNHESRRFLSLRNNNISIQHQYYLVGAIAYNPAGTASMLYFGANYSFGMQYHFRPANRFHVLVGGSWDVDFGFKDLTRNINNPVNMDMATNLNVSGVIRYDVSLLRMTLRLQLSAETPVVGLMFVPLAGASYYEMFELGNHAGLTHFSSLHNKRGINPKLTVNIPFARSTWQVGLAYQHLKYEANDMVFKRNSFSLMVGTTFDVVSFSGRKKKLSPNFISTNE